MKANNNTTHTIRHTLTIGWLYPELMSTYGDRGNIIVLKKRCEWRGIYAEIIPINQQSENSVLKKVDLFFGGGAQDREQEIVMNDLKKEKGELLKQQIEQNIPALFVCGSPQLMGKYYEPSEGNRIEGLGIFDMVTIHPGPKDQRLIGNIVAEITDTNILRSKYGRQNTAYLIGFENHGGRTHLGKNVTPLAKVIKGFGNNGEDKTEGVVYKNAFGTYLHGPLLPKNPQIADYLISKALEIKYHETINLEELDNILELKAQQVILKRLR